MSNLVRPYDLNDSHDAARFLLDALTGFEESDLFEDYQEYEGFTDEEWGSAITCLRAHAEEKEPEVD